MKFQRFAGVSIIALSIIPAILDADSGAFMILAPLGLYLLFTRKQVMF